MLLELLIGINPMQPIFDGLLFLLAKKEIVYSCPKCNADIKYEEKKCNHCNVNLSWNEKSFYQINQFCFPRQG
jgi:hypothetical protein